MKVLSLTPQKLNTENKNSAERNNVQFKGAENLLSVGLRFLDTNQAVGATAVDLGSMVIPRTLTDFSRGANAGMETMRREGSGTVNHGLIGMYGTLAGLALAIGISNKFGVKAEKIFADSSTWDQHGANWFKHAKGGNADKALKPYINEFIDNISVYDADTKVWKAVDKDKKAALTDAFEKALKDGKQNKHMPSDTSKKLHYMMLDAFGTENNFKLTKDAKSTYGLDTVISNFYNVTKSFMSEKVGNTFKNITSYDQNVFTKAMKNFNVKRSVGGLAIGAAVGMSIQPFNIYLTKKKTGSDGFVGVSGGGKDNSPEFKMKKILGGLAFLAMTLASIGKPKDLLKNIQFQGMIPTLNQFKLIYGVTIMSRFFASRSNDELRETAVKDTLGFLNWLVLGNFVAKGAAYAMDKSLVYDKSGSKGFKWLINSALKTRDEVLHGALKKNGISTLDKEGKAINFKNLLKLLPNADKLTKSKLRYLSIAQVAGYLYSGLVLGVGIPRLNIYMTNKREQKRQAQRAYNQVDMYKPENLAFLSKQMNFTSNKLLSK